MLRLSSSCSLRALLHFSETALQVIGVIILLTSISRFARTTRGIFRLLEEHLSRPDSQSLTEYDEREPLIFWPFMSL